MSHAPLHIQRVGLRDGTSLYFSARFVMLRAMPGLVEACVIPVLRLHLLLLLVRLIYAETCS